MTEPRRRGPSGCPEDAAPPLTDSSVNNVAFYKNAKRTRFLNFLPGSRFRTALAHQEGWGSSLRAVWGPQPRLAPAFGTRLAAQTSSQRPRCGGSAASPGPGSGTGSAGCARPAPFPSSGTSSCRGLPPHGVLTERGLPSRCPRPVGSPAPSVAAAGEPGSAGGLQPPPACEGLSYGLFAWGTVPPRKVSQNGDLRRRGLLFFSFKLPFYLKLPQNLLTLKFWHDLSPLPGSLGVLSLSSPDPNRQNATSGT